ncbi:hypothetical protein CesoFtcFv8_015414 [Champsocephalus esox]|uniref:Uncharacterized protein n=1 Tax=Champsocephalus esox TaxID=159716 RepID=A0AAN8BQ90_9TELE|nr:hypothetical protein CesoFtcFv8_015414 [Champsocephalus esox]
MSATSMMILKQQPLFSSLWEYALQFLPSLVWYFGVFEREERAKERVSKIQLMILCRSSCSHLRFNKTSNSYNQMGRLFKRLLRPIITF